MPENDSAPGAWGHHNLKTAADVRRMLRGEAAPSGRWEHSGQSMSGMKDEHEGETTPPTPALPAGAVSATIETVEEHPLQTTETVEYVEDGTKTAIDGESPKRAGKKAD